MRQKAKMDAIGNLTGGVAHDFNNLLAVILGNLELLKDTALDAKGQAYVDAAIGATERGADLTKNMLGFARKAPLKPVQIDLNEVVLNTQNWSARVLPATINVETSLLEGLWQVEADVSSTQNAILNLIVNARDAMSTGGTLTIETANVLVDENSCADRQGKLEPGRYIRLTITDTGCGIPKDKLDSVFEPFYTTKGPGKGSGLGLSMVQGFMNQTGGTIQVYSEPDKGATFELYFCAMENPSPRSHEPVRAETIIDGQGAKILIAEDEAGVLTVLSQTLQNSGYDVVTAQSGDDALEVYEKVGGFDLLLTDIVMPGTIQGPELSKRIREIDDTLPVVFMSGYASESTIHGNGLRSEDIRLMKPVGKKELIQAIEEALSIRKNRTQEAH